MLTKHRHSFKLNRSVNNTKLCTTCCAVPPWGSGGGMWCIPCENPYSVPQTFEVTFSGITVNNTPSFVMWGYEVPGSGQWCNETHTRWQWCDFGSIDNTYAVPMKPFYHKDEGGTVYHWHCAGSAELPFSGNLIQYRHSGEVCGGDIVGEPTISEFERIRIGVGVTPVNASGGTTPPYTHYRVSVTADVLFTNPDPTVYQDNGIRMFSGSDEVPIDTKTCFSNSMANTIVDPYVCQVYGSPCLFVDMKYAWGGSASVQGIGTYQFPVWLERFNGPTITGNSSGWYLGGSLKFADEVCPGLGGLKVQFRVDCDLGSFVSESPWLGTYYDHFIGVAIPPGSVPGFTTVTITNVIFKNPNIVWDRSRDLAPSFISGVL